MTWQVLVADDSQTIQKVVKIAFTRFDVEITEAHSLSQAVALASDRNFDVIVADAKLPEAEAAASLQAFADAGCKAPVVLMVGTFESIDEEAFRQLGFSQFLKKPFDSEEILAKVAAAVGRPMNPSPAMVEPSIGAPPPAPETFEHLVAEPSHFNLPPPPVAADDAAAVDEQPSLPVPPPVSDLSLKGRPAFAGNSSPTTIPPIGEQISPAEAVQPGSHQDDLGNGHAKVDPVEVQQLVRQAVEAYCSEHFPALAREVITKEIRRLTQERVQTLSSPPD